jgi:hypothetical protein
MTNTEAQEILVVRVALVRHKARVPKLLSDFDDRDTSLRSGLEKHLQNSDTHFLP